MNEKDVLKQSVKVFIGGLVIFSIVGFVLKQISFPLGFILGYAVSVFLRQRHSTQLRFQILQK